MGFDHISKNIYEKAREIIEKNWKGCRVQGHRKSWDQYNMSIAYEAAKRSHDRQTKVGAYLTTEDHIPIATGYNGFPRKAMDHLLPNVRPEKYPWMIHAEINAILNAALQGQSTKDSVLYCTHRPCFNCTIMIWQAGCREVIFDKNNSDKLSSNEETEINLAIFDIVTGGKFKIREMDFDF